MSGALGNKLSTVTMAWGLLGVLSGAKPRACRALCLGLSERTLELASVRRQRAAGLSQQAQRALPTTLPWCDITLSVSSPVW